MQFAIIEHDISKLAGDPCGVCGQPTDPREFDVVVLTDRGAEPVCDTCSELHATELMYMRNVTALDVRVPVRRKRDERALLDHYAPDEIEHFIEYECYADYGDPDVVPDRDGDVMFCFNTWKGDFVDPTLLVHVYIRGEAECADVVRLMHKLADRASEQFSSTDEHGNVIQPLVSTTAGRAVVDHARERHREQLKQKLVDRNE
jgi:hypothetical protein